MPGARCGGKTRGDSDDGLAYEMNSMCVVRREAALYKKPMILCPIFRAKTNGQWAN